VSIVIELQFKDIISILYNLKNVVRLWEIQKISLCIFTVVATEIELWFKDILSISYTLKNIGLLFECTYNVNMLAIPI